jgi:hypothetical protein
MYKNKIELLVSIAKDLINGIIPSIDSIRQNVTEANKIIQATSEEVESAIKKLEAENEILMETGFSIEDKEIHQDWFNPFDFDLAYWKDYREYLLKRKNFPIDIVEKMDQISNKITNLLGNPNASDNFARKGLIIGDVQSGKTSSYLSVMNKAADVGYKYIVLLAGSMNTLRSQTQERVDEGFIGTDSELRSLGNSKSYIGVGIINPFRKRPSSFTTREKDFSNKIAQQLVNISSDMSSVPNVFVIKKNSNTLKNLINWMSITLPGNKENLPLLLIDDEADYASINTRKEGQDPTAINLKIRELLALFPKSTLLSYTATPFANVFIEPTNENEMMLQDLFPKDFIYVLDSPSNYIGPNEYYGLEGAYNENIVLIDDMEDFIPNRHKKDYRVHVLPPSLKEAIRLFMISNAIRDLRNEKSPHRSMLVNLSVYTNIQNQVADLIKDFFSEEINKIKYKISYADTTRLYENLIDQNYKSLELDSRIIIENLFQANKDIVISAINSENKAEEVLNYKIRKDLGLKIIAIGGYILSRGLTLEGLSISYFHRNSKYYDTLMQMGRWFGYRPGYEDLCKVYMQEDAIEWYRYINETSQELKAEVEIMSRKNLTPRDFGLRVLNSHKVLEITAPNKLRYSNEIERVVSVSARVLEGPRIFNVKEINKNNIKLADDLIKKLNKEYKNEGFYLKTKNTPSPLFKFVDKDIIIDFFESFSHHPSNLIYSTSDIVKIINGNPLLEKWDVYFAEGDGKPHAIEDFNIRRSLRSYSISSNMIQISKQRNRLGFASATKAGLSDEIIRKIVEKTDNDKLSETSYLIGIVRNPLLIIYHIQLEHKNITDTGKASFDFAIGIALAFPDIEGKGKVKEVVHYKLNRVAFDEYLLSQDQSDEEDE